MTELDCLIVKEEVRSLQARYVRLADTQDWTALSNLFAVDAQFQAHDVAGSLIGTMAGREEIATGIAAGVGASAIVIHHLFSNEIDVASHTAAFGIWAMEDWIERQGSIEYGAFRAMRGLGHYHVDYRKMGGHWLIADLKLYRTRLDFTF